MPTATPASEVVPERQAPKAIIQPEYTRYAGQHEHQLLALAELTMPALCSNIPADLSSPVGSNIVLVLDRSGSMRGPKMVCLKQTVQFVISHLRDIDALCIIDFDDKVSTTFPLELMTADARSRAQAALVTIEARGGTIIMPALTTALGVLMRPSMAERPGAVLLLSDGMNSGEFEPSALCEEANKMNVPIHAFGLGDGHDSSLMSNLASKTTSGAYTFIQTPSDIGDAFAACVGILQTIFTNDFVLQFSVPDGSDVHISSFRTLFNAAIQDGGKSASVTLGAAFADEKKQVLVALQLPAATVLVDGPSEVEQLALELRMRYTHITSGEVVHTVPVALNVMRYFPANDAERSAFESARGFNERVDVASNRDIAAKAMQAAAIHLARRRAAEAIALLDRAIKELQASQSSTTASTAGLLRDLHTTRERMKHRETADSGTALAYVASRAMAMQRFTSPRIESTIDMMTPAQGRSVTMVRESTRDDELTRALRAPGADTSFAEASLIPRHPGTPSRAARGVVVPADDTSDGYVVPLRRAAARGPDGAGTLPLRSRREWAFPLDASGGTTDGLDGLVELGLGSSATSTTAPTW